MWGRAHQRPLKRHDVERVDAESCDTAARGHSASMAATMATASSVLGAGEMTGVVEGLRADTAELTGACCRVCGVAALRAWCAAS